MNDFNSLFPNFLDRCMELRAVLLPVAYVLLTAGLVNSAVVGRRTAGYALKTIARMFVYVVLLTHIIVWGNDLCAIADSVVHDTLQADPGKVYEDYQAALTAQKNSSSTSSGSWWDKLFNAGTSIFEALISSILWLFGLLAATIVFYAYLLQKFILYLGYALSPIFIGFLGLRSLNFVGRRFLMSLVGITIWPLGWGATSIVTGGLLDFMTDQSFLLHNTAPGGAGYTFQNIIGVAVLGIWIIFSTIAAPLVIQKAIATGIQAGADFLTGATSAAITAASTGATGVASTAMGGGLASAAAGAVVGGAAGAMTLASSSANGANAGNVINSLAYMGGAMRRTNTPKSSERESFPANDLTGDKTVRDLLDRTRNSS